MKHGLLSVLIAASATFASSAMAADDHKGHDHGGKNTSAHADDVKPVHGGVVTVVKDVNYELVIKSDTIFLYVTDHGKPVALKGASGKLTLLTAANKMDIVLSAANDRLEAKGDFKLAPGTKAMAVVKMAEGAATTVRFTLK
jgi:hypothetical protein